MRTIETIKSGKMQMNSKSGKDFRAIMAKWHNADFELAEEDRKLLFIETGLNLEIKLLREEDN